MLQMDIAYYRTDARVVANPVQELPLRRGQTVNVERLSIVQLVILLEALAVAVLNTGTCLYLNSLVAPLLTNNNYTGGVDPLPLIVLL